VCRKRGIFEHNQFAELISAEYQEVGNTMRGLLSNCGKSK
jgi:hypothetical protein